MRPKMLMLALAALLGAITTVPGTVRAEPQTPLPRILVSDLLGKPVRGADGASLGRAVDVVLRRSDGQILGALLDTRGLQQSQHDAWKLLPLASLQQAGSEREWQLLLEREAVLRLPGYDRRKAAADPNRVLATRVLGSTVECADGPDFGELSELVLDLPWQRARYVGLTRGRRIYYAPWALLFGRMPAEEPKERILRLDRASAQMQTAPSLPRPQDGPPTPAHLKRVDRFYVTDGRAGRRGGH